MQLIDLSREIHHMMQRLPNHPSVIVTPYSTHDEIREAEGVTFSSATLALALGDHAGTLRAAGHQAVDGPQHPFDPQEEERQDQPDR